MGSPWPLFEHSLDEQREKNFKSTIQPWRQGQLSKEYLEAYGTKSIKPTPKEIKSAKYTWKDLRGWRTRHKSQ